MSTHSLTRPVINHTHSQVLDPREAPLDPHETLYAELQSAHSTADLGYNSQNILYQASYRASNNELRAPTPEEVDLLEKVIHQSLNPDLIPVNGIKYTFPNLEVTTYESEFIPPLNPEWSIQVIQSPMGTDKTGKLCQYIHETKTESATFTSPRRTFTRSCTARLRDNGIPVKSYLEQPILETDPFVIISAESLRQLKNVPGVLAMDEATGMFTQMNSGLHRNLGDNQQMLITLIQNTPRIVLMDAHIDSRVLMILHLLRPNEVIHYQINTVKKRKDWVAFPLDEITMYNQLSHDLNTGRNVKIICGSEKYAEKYIEPIIKASVGESKYRFYHSKGGKIEPNELDNVDATWSKLRALMFTSTITQGINYTRKHFHSTYIFGHSQSNTIEEVAQMMGRVRNLINPPGEEDEPKKVYFWNQTRNEKLPDTYEAIKRQIETHLLVGSLDMIKFLGPESRQLCIHGSKMCWELKETFWTWLSLQNQLVKNRSRNNYNNLFLDMLTSQGIGVGKTIYLDNADNVEYSHGVRYYLKENNAQIKEFKEWKTLRNTTWKSVQVEGLSNAAWLLGFKQIQQYRSKRENGEATSDELITLKKSELLQHIDPQYRENLASDGYRLVILSDNLHQLLNCQMVRDWTSRDVAFQDIKTNNYNLDVIPQLELPQFEGINWLCQIVGVRNVLDRDTIVWSETIRQRSELVIQNIALLDARFKTSHQQVKDYGGVLRYINARFRSWAGCVLHEVNRKRLTIDGKRVLTKYYSLKAPDGFDKILHIMTPKISFSSAKPSS